MEGSHVRNASQLVVTLEPVLESINDYNQQSNLEGARYEPIEILTNSIEMAEKYELLTSHTNFCLEFRL
jgi:hypothetical protein